MSDDTIVQNIQTQPETETKQTIPQEQIESQKEQNLRILRERAENAEKRIAEMERYLSQQHAKPQQSQQEDDINLDDDSYVEAKYVKKIIRELNETKKQVADVSQKAFQSTAEFKLKTQHPDFDAIVTEENIRTLASNHPEDYATLMANPDLYTKGKTAYNMIKRYGLLEKYEKVDKKIEENKSKPRSAGVAPAQVADTPLTRIGEYDRRVLSEDRKKQLMSQVSEAKKYS